MANILLVDNPEHIRNSLNAIYTKGGHHISEAASAEETIALMMDDIYDIAVVDFKMDQSGGLDFLREVKDISPDIEVIILMKDATIGTAVEAMKLGIYDFVTRPVNIEELMLIVNRILENMELTGSIRALQTQIRERYSFPDIVGNTSAMTSIFSIMEKACQFDSAVLITGESGTGKELVARAIHANGLRSSEPFIPMNCAAFPESLQESELFGHMKGSFTDAIRSKKGLFEEAHGGTVFLDEIADASMSIQAKLLRFLQNGEIRRVGSNNPVYADVRLIAATSIDLNQAMQEGTFRSDLYYRINVIRIHLPPLRDRRDDIPLLTHHFITKYTRSRKRNVRHISREALSILMDYDWPGNVRELENAIQHAVALTQDDVILPPVLPERVQSYNSHTAPQNKGAPLSLHDLEKAYILQILEECSWDCTEAARKLGIGRATVYRKLKEYNFTKLSRSK